MADATRDIRLLTEWGTPVARGPTLRAGRIEPVLLTGVDPADIVRSGVVQVPEGRRIFGDLTVEENLRAGAFGSRMRHLRDRDRERRS